jgi:hypothetical protein
MNSIDYIYEKFEKWENKTFSQLPAYFYTAFSE